MIPRTFPSSLNTFSGETQMVVYLLGSVAGLTRWVDYIPVAWATASSQRENSYDANGFVAIDSLSSTTGKQAWVDYVPCYVDPSAAGAWQVTPTGFVPVNYGSGNITGLFANNVEGAWFDASDMATLFQDAAGTTPVTAVEQPVGKWLDKSGRGNHATQSTAASRPVLSARYNLLTQTETGSSWNHDSLTYTFYNSPVASAGSLSSWGYTNMGLNYPRANADVSSGVEVKCSAYLWVASGSVTVRPAAYYSGAWQLLASAFTLTSTPQLVKWTYTPTSATSFGSGLALQVQGAGDLRITGADLRLSADASLSIPAYQRVNTSTDYDSTGFPLYLKFDGVDDSLSTGSINFTSTDKMTVWAGVTKLSDAAAYGTAAEFGNRDVAQPGSFSLSAPGSSAGEYYLAIENSGTVSYEPATFTAPINSVLTGSFNFAGATVSDQITPRVNGVINRSNPFGLASAGNFGNYPLYIGRRGGSTLPFNGRLTQLIVRGAATADVSLTERFVGKKTGIIL